MTARIIRADARALPLPDESVDLIVTSPPYFAMRDYKDGDASLAGQIGNEHTPAEYITALLKCTAEWVRVLKPTGSIFVNLGDKYSQYEGLRRGHGRSIGRTERESRGEPLNMPVGAPAQWGVAPKSLMLLPERYRIGCVDHLGLLARAVVIWSKPNGLPESVTDRVRRSHEDWVHLTKAPRYYAAVDEIREPHSAPKRVPGANSMGGRNTNLVRTSTGAYEGPNPLGKLPGSVWDVATQPLRVPERLAVDHFAAFPPALVRPIILGWSPPGGLVLDPFGGTGTTALVASVHGRHGISVDRSADYCRLAAWRTTDAGERARAKGLPKPPPVPAGQDSLFEEIA